MNALIVAFYGAGMLCSPMVRAMLRPGIAFRVRNRTPQRAQALEHYGAHAFTDPVETARGADRVHLCLSDDASVDAVLNAAAAGIQKRVPFSTIPTVSLQRVAERSVRLAQGGYAFLHAPVFMGPPMALESHGVMMTSGDATLFEEVHEHLAAMCSDLRYVGAGHRRSHLQAHG